MAAKASRLAVISPEDTLIEGGDIVSIGGEFLAHTYEYDGKNGLETLGFVDEGCSVWTWTAFGLRSISSSPISLLWIFR